MLRRGTAYNKRMIGNPRRVMGVDRESGRKVWDPYTNAPSREGYLVADDYGVMYDPAATDGDLNILEEDDR